MNFTQTKNRYTFSNKYFEVSRAYIPKLFGDEKTSEEIEKIFSEKQKEGTTMETYIHSDPIGTPRHNIVIRQPFTGSFIDASLTMTNGTDQRDITFTSPVEMYMFIEAFHGITQHIKQNGIDVDDSRQTLQVIEAQKDKVDDMLYSLKNALEAHIKLSGGSIVIDGQYQRLTVTPYEHHYSISSDKLDSDHIHTGTVCEAARICTILKERFDNLYMSQLINISDSLKNFIPTYDTGYDKDMVDVVSEIISENVETCLGEGRTETVFNVYSTQHNTYLDCHISNISDSHPNNKVNIQFILKFNGYSEVLLEASHHTHDIQNVGGSIVNMF